MCTIKYKLILLLTGSTLLLNACSSVRDATDWIPGVDSNEEKQAAAQQKAHEERNQQWEEYTDKSAFAPTGNASMDDAQINVLISQRYSQNELIKREDIGIEVNNRIVTLSGSVTSAEMAVRAIAIAKDTMGVSRVISRLVIISLRQSGELKPYSHTE